MSTGPDIDPAGNWQWARAALARGHTVRQIAQATGLEATQIETRIQKEHWPAPPPPDWLAVRQDWESGLSISTVARRHGMCADTVRKRRRKQNWQRHKPSGLDALRRAVKTLEQALDQCDAADPVSTARLAAALSMAAGRLSRAEKQRLNLRPPGDDSGDDFAAQDESFRTQAIALLCRLGGAEAEEAARADED